MHFRASLSKDELQVMYIAQETEQGPNKEKRMSTHVACLGVMTLM